MVGVSSKVAKLTNMGLGKGAVLVLNQIYIVWGLKEDFNIV